MSAPHTPQAPVLLLEHVSKWYGPVIGVNQVTLELRPGITGLVGHNGSGKTTLLRLAAGQVKPDLGRVLVRGQDAWTAAAKWHVGYCPELDRFYEEMSGRRFVQAMARLCGFPRREANRRTEDALTLVGMRDRAHKTLAGYSKGMRQRIKLAQALLHDPALLLLDEPLSGIDPIGRRESIDVFHRLAGMGKCLLISSHELEELDKLTDHVAIMAAGRIVAVGEVPRIRDLLDDHPLSVRVASDRNRALAAALLDCEDVVGLDRLPGDEGLIVRARHPRRFFEKITALAIEENIEIRRLETLDESTQDVLGYLLGAARNGS
ncbi:MAG: ABC transporter ATP-binding protein [Gemmataceae bacterium]|nr:ABC transporter ATP-binding protein [Gemmataceae bacterium]MCI0743241.1 ABC transporter ATP-binding protein [Gemmataceae bacterium]